MTANEKCIFYLTPLNQNNYLKKIMLNYFVFHEVQFFCYKNSKIIWKIRIIITETAMTWRILFLPTKIIKNFNMKKNLYYFVTQIILLMSFLYYDFSERTYCALCAGTNFDIFCDKYFNFHYLISSIKQQRSFQKNKVHQYFLKLNF